jgi:ATP-binding cassette, subfamily A (ABC1), member 3
VREHLELFSGIRCIPYEMRQRVINYKLHELDLERFQNVLSVDLSGGNKRKLQVAMAMLGNPKVIFLDEPSTGMDPVARRFMWDVISRVATQKKQSSIVLTTHSMEEAEALCTRMGIMVNGELKCLGSI